MRSSLLMVISMFLLMCVTVCSGLRCSQDCADVKCPKLRKRRCQPVRKLCECCPVCAAGVGKPCGGLETPCKKRLWCIIETETEIVAKKVAQWPDPFHGVCGKLNTLTKRRKHKMRGKHGKGRKHKKLKMHFLIRPKSA